MRPQMRTFWNWKTAGFGEKTLHAEELNLIEVDGKLRSERGELETPIISA